jgi:hypothetical protein
MVTSYKAVNWTPNEVIGETKMDRMTGNADYLFARTPRTVYTLPSGLTRAEGVRIAAGRVVIAKNTKRDSATAQVNFGNFFSSRCEPLITTGIVSEGQQRIFAVINGIGRLQPDARGFQTTVNIAAEADKNDAIMRSFYVTWQAVGY